MNAFQDDGAPAPARTETGASPNATGRERTTDTGKSTSLERTFEVFTAPKKDSRTWRSEAVTWDEFTSWAEEPADRKECGNYIFGTLRGGRRTKNSVVSRSAVQLDADKATEATWEALRALGARGLVHTTFSSRPDALRLRAVLPLDRDVTPAEYVHIVEGLMDHLGREQFDSSTSQAERYMFRPSRNPERPDHYRFEELYGPELSADEWLADFTPEPDALDGDILPPRSDAREAPGIVGAVARAYSFAEVIAAYELPYEAVGGRWKYLYGDGNAGLHELDGTHGYAFTHQTSDPAHNGGHRVSAFDLVRLHRFGDLDRDASQRAAEELFKADPKVAAEMPTDAPAPTGSGPLAVRLRERVAELYDTFPAEDDGRIFAQPRAGGRAELLTGPFVIRACAGLGTRSGSLSTAATEAAKVACALAEEHEPRALSLRADYRPGRIVLDLAQHGSGRCVVVTPEGWTVQETPPPGVVFLSPGLPLPTPERGGSVEELRALLRWPEDDPRWPLVKGWLPASLLATIPRPMLGFFGPQGSAKTTTGRYVVGVIDPKPAGVLGGGFGKNRRDDESKALKNYLPAWDNVSSMSGEVADFLSRMITGEHRENRKLYSDAEVVSIAYRRSGVVTGLTVPRGMKADTLDRFVLVQVEPLEGARLSEGALEAEWTRVHPRALAGVLDLAVRMLARLEDARGANTAGLRMADYAEALWAVDPGLYESYADNVSTARADMAADDPFIGALVRWLDDLGGAWEGTAEAGRRAVEPYRTDDLDMRFWPKDGRGFSQELTRTSELLRSIGIRVENRRSNGARLKAITRVSGGAR